jgi:hypothetical protein
MGIYTKAHSEISAGGLYEFGFYKALRQTKSVIVNMLNNFFSERSKAFGIVMPDIFSTQNTPNSEKKVHTVRDFPFEERKFPLIVVSNASAKERKPYIGSDNLLYIDVQENPDGNKNGVNVYAGMADVNVMLGIIATSPDERMMLAELILICFTHYYRGQFIYQGVGNELFSITPGGNEIDFGTETEITDESDTTTVYVVDAGIGAFIEYHFEDPLPDKVATEVQEVSLDDDMDERLGITERS